MDNWQTTLEGYVQAFLEAEAKAHAQKVAMEACRQDKAAAEADMREAKDQLRGILEEAGVMSDDTSIAKITLSKGRDSIKYDDNFDPSKLSVEYVKLERKPDTTQIKAALARGIDVPGARMERGASTVSIKVKEKANG